MTDTESSSPAANSAEADPVDNSWPGLGDGGYGQEAAAVASPERPPTLRLEVVVVAGDEGRWLAARQAAVIREVLGWFTKHQAGTPDEPGPPAAA